MLGKDTTYEAMKERLEGGEEKKAETTRGATFSPRNAPCWRTRG